jgi:hypothetical protein
MLDGLDVQRDWRTRASDGWCEFILAWIPLN